MNRYYFFKTGLLLMVAAFFFSTVALAQPKATGKKAASGRVKQIDIEGLKPLLKPNGKPLLINFWATWCDPCREEFPDLVKISDEFSGRIDFLTISLDDLADINGDVPRFLKEMNSKIPAYLLHTPDESAAISLVSPQWTGNLPMTILFNADGTTAYARNGKIRVEVLRDNINKVLLAGQTK